MIKGIIFDLDGVLISTDVLHFQCWKMIADKLGIYYDEKVNSGMKGLSRAGSLDYILSYNHLSLDDNVKEELLFEKNEKYKEMLKTLTKDDVSPDLRLTLGYLKNHGYKLAVGSSSKNTKLILKQIEIIDYFDAICDGNDVTKYKPDPEVFLKAAQMLKLKPSECYVVEDATNGIDAATSGGFKSIGVKDASFYFKTTFKINNIKEIIDIVKNN